MIIDPPSDIPSPTLTPKPSPPNGKCYKEELYITMESKEGGDIYYHNHEWNHHKRAALDRKYIKPILIPKQFGYSSFPRTLTIRAWVDKDGEKSNMLSYQYNMCVNYIMPTD